MPLSFRCPECQNLVSVNEDLAGLHGQCPACAAAIQFPLNSSNEGESIQAGPSPLPPSSQNLEHSFAAKPAPGILAEGWKTVRIGLMMTLAGVGVLAALLLLSLVVGWMDQARPEAREKLGNLVAIIWLIGVGASLLTIFLGLCVCCTTPTQAQAREFALLSLVCAVVTGICVVVYALSLKAFVDQAMNAAFRNVAAGGHPGAIPDKLWSVTTVTLILAGLSGFCSHVLFVFYLRHLARFFGSESLVNNTAIYLRVLLILAAVNIFFAFLPRPENRGLHSWIAQALPFAGVVMLFWLVGLIQLTQEAIAAALKQQT